MNDHFLGQNPHHDCHSRHDRGHRRHYLAFPDSGHHCWDDAYRHGSRPCDLGDGGDGGGGGGACHGGGHGDACD